ncbi:unnamed protein product [Penicillium roqueforti FM164]|uniref:Uncharacterized protein n=1 Tax=Penicillium roqueforti (strain FM164) TaxID=1365484 RepID=W6QIU2_PENRF|nr:unnamed protein product [Penicillium roqueforti FM164]
MSFITCQENGIIVKISPVEEQKETPGVFTPFFLRVDYFFHPFGEKKQHGK